MLCISVSVFLILLIPCISVSVFLILLIPCLSICLYAAEDWLNPAIVLEAFEARSVRMSVACAKSLSQFSNPEEGKLSITW